MYSTVDELEAAVAALAAAYPAVTSLLTAPHATHEGRTTHVLRIGADPQAEGIAVLGGVHAREWVPPEAVIGLAADLLEAHSLGTGLLYGGAVFTAEDIARVVSSLSLYVFACVNPDGRHWSQTSQPLWRKNRRPGAQPGVDVNRNFDFLWDHLAKFAPDADVATSASPADDTYRGPSVASEPETQNVVWLVDSFPVRWLVDVHSAVPVVLYSWGSDANQSADPTMNFLNTVYDPVRGRIGDAVGEYITSHHADAGETLARRMSDAAGAVRGSTWPAEQAMTLYPTSGASDDYTFSRRFADPAKRQAMGWTIECGTSFQPSWAEAEQVMAETASALLRFARDAREVTDGTRVTLVTPAISIDPEEGTTLASPVEFIVEGAHDVTLTAELTGPFSVPLGAMVTVPAPGLGSSATGRVWVAWTAGGPGSSAAGSVVVHCRETGQTWTVPISATALPPVRTALVVALDASGSMLAGAGDGRSRAEVLREAASVLVALLAADDGIGVVRFETDASIPLPVTVAGPEVFGAGRAAASARVTSYAPDAAGLTSIGDAVIASQAALAGAAGFDGGAVMVFTDGQQTAPAWISDVVPGARTFAVGLGTPADIDPAALTALTDHTGGFVTVTGVLSVDERFVLSRYFLRVLAGATNQQIVTG